MSLIVAGGSQTVTAVEFLLIHVGSDGKADFSGSSWSVLGHLTVPRTMFPSVGIMDKKLVIFGGVPHNYGSQSAQICATETMMTTTSTTAETMATTATIMTTATIPTTSTTTAKSTKPTTTKPQRRHGRSIDYKREFNNIGFECFSTELGTNGLTNRYDHSTVTVTKEWCNTVF